MSAEASNGGVQNLNLMADGDADISVAVTSIITEQRQVSMPLRSLMMG